MPMIFAVVAANVATLAGKIHSLNEARKALVLHDFCGL